MNIAPGSRLGPYELVATLGVGGMGEVYRARDARLGRDVALKVLGEEVATDPARLRRFEHEARAASALSHPNIVTVYDIGVSETVPYIAMEYIIGRTLRELLQSGPMPTKKLLDVAVQIAQGLARAHEAGIVHRDLKPENVIVSEHGVVKILDFGLAKLSRSPVEGEAGGALSTATAGTQPGVLLGTYGYMSPEQARGLAVDFRSDQFSFGSVLYEMAAGRRAFEGKTPMDTLSAVLNAEPEPRPPRGTRIPAPVRWIVERCLSKDPKDRYASTEDLARDLAAVREHLSEVSGTGQDDAPLGRMLAPRRRWLALAIGTVAIVSMALWAGITLGRSNASFEPPLFRQLTFRGGSIASARFAPDGETVVYGAAWEGSPVEVFLTRSERPESRPLGLPGADILAVSRSGEMALSLNRHSFESWIETGTLARMGMASVGPPREVLEGVDWADWSPDGKELSIIREVGEDKRSVLEYPIGKVLSETPSGYLSHPRVSPKGDLVAFLEHPVRGDDAGGVAVVDRAGKKKVLVAEFTSVAGLGWSMDGRELWFAGAPSGTNRALHAVSLAGQRRLLARVTGSMVLNDVSASGRVLITHERRRQHMVVLPPGETRERELSWLDYSLVRDISADGRAILFVEGGEGGGPDYSVFLRKTDGSPAIRLGDGDGQALSPDGKWAVAIVRRDTGDRLVLYPAGAGEARSLPLAGFNVGRARWLPDGKRILLSASEGSRGERLYLQDAAGGEPRPISPEGYAPFSSTISPDGKLVAVHGPDQNAYLYPIEGGTPTPLPMLAREDALCGWSADGRYLFVTVPGGRSKMIDRLEVVTGRRNPWKEITPPDSIGMPAGLLVSRAGDSYAYSYVLNPSDLYVVEGLK